MRYRGRRGSLAAKVELFVRGPAMPGRFEGKTPEELLSSGEWAWHDLGTAMKSPPGALTVWTFNGKSRRWGVGNAFALEADGLPNTRVEIAEPTRWISAVTFLSSDGSVYPDTIVLHIANAAGRPLKARALRLWLPKPGGPWQTLWPDRPMKVSATIPGGDRGFIRQRIRKLPLTFAALEVSTPEGSIWAHLRIKREAFDIGGGWVGDNVTQEPFLQLLAHMHVNTGNIGAVPGYTDNHALYDRLPLKLINRFDPPSAYDSETWLAKIHAVEFLGEPQYGGGHPVPPQEVFDKLLPYRSSPLPTSLTNSEERIWQWYAGLSDYPHYDAYRVVAPAPDEWVLYDRWGGRKIRWGAPLETVGDMCRSLREISRPMPCAFWAQGPWDGWDDPFDGRRRRTPTPDELRSQAIHALSTRITSLYWFNLSLKALMMFPDTWEQMTRIGREIRTLDMLYLEGDAYRFERTTRPDGSPDWDLASIAAPSAAVLFALDTAYAPDPVEHVFKFGLPRRATFRYALPYWLRNPRDVFRIDADGIHAVRWRATESGVEIVETASRDAVFVAARDPEMRKTLEKKRLKAIAEETAHPIDHAALEALMKAGTRR
jgi:hypothetical protein